MRAVRHTARTNSTETAAAANAPSQPGSDTWARTAAADHWPSAATNATVARTAAAMAVSAIPQANDSASDAVVSSTTACAGRSRSAATS